MDLRTISALVKSTRRQQPYAACDVAASVKSGIERCCCRWKTAACRSRRRCRAVGVKSAPMRFEMIGAGAPQEPTARRHKVNRLIGRLHRSRSVISNQGETGLVMLIERPEPACHVEWRRRGRPPSIPIRSRCRSVSKTIALRQIGQLRGMGRQVPAVHASCFSL